MYYISHFLYCLRTAKHKEEKLENLEFVHSIGPVMAWITLEGKIIPDGKKLNYCLS